VEAPTVIDVDIYRLRSALNAHPQTLSDLCYVVDLGAVHASALLLELEDAGKARREELDGREVWRAV
jgi:hypothetical protein